ncbi:hypothetical protein OG225_27275 [Nocardia sp. NBC_01377]|uniref:hypothetical protein n=2 Tax=Nocardia TaxID=1817 RepID=UPI003255BD91
MERHIAVESGIEGLPTMHYRAEESAAAAFVAEMRRLLPARAVRVDNRVTREMRPLPCQRLYQEG